LKRGAAVLVAPEIAGPEEIAKFNRPDDDYDVGRWECVAMSLAEMAGMDVESWELEALSGRSVLLMRRFDRAGNVRTPFLSARIMGFEPTRPKTALAINKSAVLTINRILCIVHRQIRRIVYFKTRE
jgi:HipA-like protein